MSAPRPKVSYGWWIVLTAALGLTLGVVPMIVFSVAIFFRSPSQEFHASRAGISLAFALHNLSRPTRSWSIARQAVPDDGVLLLVELALPDGNLPSAGKLMDIAMLVLTGGKERTVQEYRELLAAAGFRLNQVAPTSSDWVVIEAMPV